MLSGSDDETMDAAVLLHLNSVPAGN